VFEASFQLIPIMSFCLCRSINNPSQQQREEMSHATEFIHFLLSFMVSFSKFGQRQSDKQDKICGKERLGRKAGIKQVFGSALEQTLLHRALSISIGCFHQEALKRGLRRASRAARCSLKIRFSPIRTIKQLRFRNSELES
jgi:hypothetical protein